MRKNSIVKIIFHISIILVWGFITRAAIAENDKNLTQRANTTKFVEFVGKGDCDAVKDYLRSGGSANTRYCSYDGREFTVIMFAASQGHVCVLKQLIEAGANINIISHPSNIEYDTPLTAAIKNGRFEVIDLLLESGAIIDITDDNEKMLVIETLKNAEEWSALPGHPSKAELERMRVLVDQQLKKNNSQVLSGTLHKLLRRLVSVYHRL
jgi:hypothetical protein